MVRQVGWQLDPAAALQDIHWLLPPLVLAGPGVCHRATRQVWTPMRGESGWCWVVASLGPGQEPAQNLQSCHAHTPAAAVPPLEAASACGPTAGSQPSPHLAKVKKLKRELSQMKQELLYKEQGFETLQQIDQKMSGGQSGYELSEAKAIMNELKSIRKAISSGEKEKQDLMQSLAKLREKFLFDQTIGRSEPDLSCSPAHSQLSLSRQTLDAGSQTDISGDVGVRSRSNLAEKVRLSLQYEEAKRSMANLKIELSKLESEAWPGALDIEKEKLMLINEKEELLKELQFVTPCKRTQDELEHLETERKRLEEELSVKSTPSDALTERMEMSAPDAEWLKEASRAQYIIDRFCDNSCDLHKLAIVNVILFASELEPLNVQ
uniref:Protein wwc2 n=1 Tax=Sphaerodactylus townsendi TaxID=933632 RepID=A0ACB8E7A6_9SAUR